MIGDKNPLLEKIAATRKGSLPLPDDALDLGPDAFGVVIDGDYLMPEHPGGDVLLCDPARRRKDGGLCAVTLRHDDVIPNVSAGTLIVRRVTAVGRRGFLLNGGHAVIPFTVSRRSLLAAVPVVAVVRRERACDVQEAGRSAA